MINWFCIRIFFISIVSLLLIVTQTILCLEDENADEHSEVVFTPPPKLDTFQIKYHFEKGDTLIYVAMSKDSISINWGDPLIRIRFERFMITCDSITPGGNFILSQRLIDFSATERDSENEQVKRTTTPWTNAIAYIEMDKYGRRYKTWNADSVSMVLPPGGPFQHFLLVPLRDDTTAMTNDTILQKLQKESWIVVDTLLSVPENGVPNPIFRANFFYRIQEMIDTLDLGKMMKLAYSFTSQSSIRLDIEEIHNRTTSVNNSGGEIFWDTLHWIPKFAFMTVEQRLTMTYWKSQRRDTGFHYINSTFVLDNFIRKNKIIDFKK